MLQNEKAELEYIINLDPDKEKIKRLMSSNKSLKENNKRLKKANSNLIIKYKLKG